MIEELLISNVRLFEGPQEWSVPISPLTVFCGTNSAGKSTLLKALLLLCQSHSDAEAINRVGRLRLAGGLVDFGSYQSFVSHNDATRDIMLGITMTDTIDYRSLQTLQKIRKEVGSIPEPPMDNEVNYRLSVRFTCGLLQPESPQSPRDKTSVPSRKKGGVQQVFLKEATFDFRSENDLQLSWRVIRDIDTDRYYMKVPRDYFDASQQFRFMETTKEEDESNASFEVLLRGMLPAGFWAKSKAKKQKDVEDDLGWSFFPLPPLLGEACRNIEIQFARVHYLGPLRSPARRYYMTNLEIDPTMDAAGEFLPYVLRDQRDQPVFYVAPRGGTNVTRKPLRYALDSWMFYLRTGEHVEADAEHDLQEIDVASMKDVLLEFKVKTFGGEAHGLADSGFGYSQILPIVVRGLIAPVGSMLIVEQPELHLNPALQVRLSEFLASLIVANKSVLIETHSEHIVNTIRVLSAEDPTDELARRCKILYVDTESGMPKLKQLQIQPNGTIPNWPRQFFGEALSISARLLKAQNKKQKGSNAK